MTKINLRKLEELRKEQAKLRQINNRSISICQYESNIEKYHRRCMEYLELIRDLKRNVSVLDDEYFSDGKEISKWYHEELAKYKKENSEKNKELTEGRIVRRILFEEILKEINSNNSSFEEKTKQYINKIRELKRNLTQDDRILFDYIDKDMYSWFIYYDQKFNHEREIDEKPIGERLEKLVCFSHIYDELHHIQKIKKM